MGQTRKLGPIFDAAQNIADLISTGEHVNIQTANQLMNAAPFKQCTDLMMEGFLKEDLHVRTCGHLIDHERTILNHFPLVDDQISVEVDVYKQYDKPRKFFHWWYCYFTLNGDPQDKVFRARMANTEKQLKPLLKLHTWCHFAFEDVFLNGRFYTERP